MVNEPILLSVRTRGKACVTDTIGIFQRILIENTAIIVLPPILYVHGIISHKLKLTEAVIPVIGSSGAVDDEVLACAGVNELLGALIRGETDIKRSTVGGFLPWIRGHGEDLSLGEIG